MRRSYRKHSRQKIGNHRRQRRKPEMRVRESDPVPSKRLPPQKPSSPIEGYDSIVSELVDLVESARRFSARSVNAVMTGTYWEIGRRIVEVEQRGKKEGGIRRSSPEETCIRSDDQIWQRIRLSKFEEHTKSSSLLGLRSRLARHCLANLLLS